MQGDPVLRWTIPGLLLIYFRLFFAHRTEEFHSLWESNSGCRSRKLRRWPLDHLHVPGDPIICRHEIIAEARVWASEPETGLTRPLDDPFWARSFLWAFNLIILYLRFDAAEPIIFFYHFAAFLLLHSFHSFVRCLALLSVNCQPSWFADCVSIEGT